MTVISLSGTSTTTSSRNEPNHTGMLFACVTANNASPQTLPVVPPQNITFSGVEITTAANPAAQAVSNDLGKDLGIKGVYGRSIEGGAGILLDMPLNPSKELSHLTLETLSNDVVIGLMGVTLQ